SRIPLRSVPHGHVSPENRGAMTYGSFLTCGAPIDSDSKVSAPEPLAGGRGPGSAGPLREQAGSLSGLDVDRAGLAATIGFQLIGNALVGLERLEASLLHRTDMDESILAAVFGLDETIALGQIEEF